MTVSQPMADAARPGVSGRAVSSAHPVPGARNRSLRLQATRVLLDAGALGAAVAAAFPLRFRWHLFESTAGPIHLAQHLAAAALWIVGVLGFMASHRLYDEDTLAGGAQEMSRLRGSLLEGVALVSVAVFLLRLVTVSRGWFLIVVAASTMFLYAERRVTSAVLRRARRRGRLRRPALLVRSEDPAPDAGALREFELLGVVEPAHASDALRAASARAGGDRDLMPVLIIDARLDRDELWRLVIEAGEAGSSVFLSSPFRALPSDRLTTRILGERTIVKVSPPVITGVRAVEKRALDIVAAAVLLALGLVPMTIIALAVLLTSGRPLFYRQQRVGRGGELFSMWKFRTMRPGAENESGPVWATVEDPRRTPLGAILRRLSLDELPQLWNVLCGDMSLVGPRPERPVFVERFTEGNPWYRFRHRIRPGITGLSQVRGLRGDTPLEPRVDADNWYIEHWSLALDLRIALRTFLAMVKGRNAH